jgi:hypothetical protein
MAQPLGEWLVQADNHHRDPARYWDARAELAYEETQTGWTARKKIPGRSRHTTKLGEISLLEHKPDLTRLVPIISSTRHASDDTIDTPAALHDIPKRQPVQNQNDTNGEEMRYIDAILTEATWEKQLLQSAIALATKTEINQAMENEKHLYVCSVCFTTLTYSKGKKSQLWPLLQLMLLRFPLLL